MTRPAWDDERIGEAFWVRAELAASTPPDLATDVIGRLDRGRPTRTAVRRGWLAAAAGLVVVVGLGAVLAGRPSATEPPAGGSASSGVTQPTGRSAIPLAAVLGAPIDVSAALAIRADPGASDRELVVAGYLSPMPSIPCPFTPAAENPTLLRCPHMFQWVMEQPEITMTLGPGSSDGGPPKGPAFNPSFALVTPPDVPVSGQGDVQPVSVVLVGHFHDRRAAQCPAEDVAECAMTFVVDAVSSEKGHEQTVTTTSRTDRWDESSQTNVTLHPRDLEADVDRFVVDAVHGGTVLSRQLVMIDRLFDVEPLLAKDDVLSAWGNPATLVWIVTILDDQGAMPRGRTFALIDGSNWFGEVTPTGMAMIERSGSAPPPTRSGPPIPSADPSAFDSAPVTVFGIKVRDVATAMQDRRADFNDLGRDEFAIRAWYVGPDPAVTCVEQMPAIHPPTPPCDEARRWLLDDPSQFGTEVGQVRRLPEHWPRALNPLLPVDVPFDVPASWTGNVPSPQPVVVLGHFLDNRVDTYAGSVFFVLDALAWTRNGAVGSLDTLTRLTAAATEDPARVMTRVDDVSPHGAVATWTTVVDATNFASIEPRMAVEAPEFTLGGPVWIIRRLILDESDGRQRLAIEWAYTTDSGSRVWLTETPDSEPDLATTIDVGPFGEHTREVKVYDYGQWIVSVRRATAADNLSWEPTNPKRDGIVEVARGATDRDVGIRWNGGACAPNWQVQVKVETRADGPGVWIQPQTNGDFCADPGEMVTRALVITFDRPIELDRVRSHDGSCCG